MAEILRRQIHPRVNIISEGVCDYIASDETVDSYRESIRADGWQFTNFEKNAPFVDSHNYSTIENLLGNVIDFRVTGRQLVERVKWAVNVPGAELAQLGWKMTEAGFLKAVSVGFWPVRAVNSWDSDPKGYQDACKDMGFTDPATAPRTIYLRQEQIELSACILGANPNALAKARQAGILCDSHLDQFPELRAAFAVPSRRNFSFPLFNPDSPSKPMPAANQTPIEAMMSALGGDRTKMTHQQRERAIAGVKMAMTSDRESMLSDAIERHLLNPEARAYWNALVRFVAGRPVPKEQAAELRRLSEESRATVTKNLDAAPTGSGVSLFIGQAMSQELFDLILIYGAFRTLGVRVMAKLFTKFSQLTGLPSSQFITPTMVAPAITPDANFAGIQKLPQAVFVSSMVPCSRQFTEDAALDLAATFLEAFTKSISATIDYACFAGNGNNDAANGGMTGMFFDATIGTVTSAIGSPNVLSLSRNDFISVLSIVSPAALQRPCRWWISPVLLPKIMQLKDGDGASWLLKTPNQTGSGEWELVGFPVTWTVPAPSIDAPGAKIAAFGEPNSYLVAIREEMEMGSSPAPGWNTLQDYIRAYSRVWCQTREPKGLATLTLGPR